MSLQGHKNYNNSMNWDQFKSLISKLERDVENKYCLLISIGVFTGFRKGDLLQLRFNQFETGETYNTRRKPKRLERLGLIKT